MKRRIPTLNEYVNERLLDEKTFQDQIPFILKLNPGDVIVVTEDFNETDIDFARMSDSKLGKITKLNKKNQLRDWHKSFLNAKKGTVLGVVLYDGSIAVNSGWYIHINQRSYLLDAMNILYIDGKLKIEKYDKKDHFQAYLVFKHNLFYVAKGNVIVKNDNIEFVTNKKTYEYIHFPKDELIITDGFDVDTGKGGLKQKIKNASLRNDIVMENGKPLNEF